MVEGGARLRGAPSPLTTPLDPRTLKAPRSRPAAAGVNLRLVRNVPSREGSPPVLPASPPVLPPSPPSTRSRPRAWRRGGAPNAGDLEKLADEVPTAPQVRLGGPFNYPFSSDSPFGGRGPDASTSERVFDKKWAVDEWWVSMNSRAGRILRETKVERGSETLGVRVHWARTPSRSWV